MQSPSSTRANIALAVAAAALAFTVAVAGGEVAVRYRERTRTSVPGTMPTLFYRHARLGHAMVRGTRYYDWVSVNPQGFRGPSVALERTPGVLRVMAIGGSTTFDSQVSRDSLAWPARLAEELRARRPDRPVEVINAGVSGYTVLDHILWNQTELRRYRPHVVILYHGHNDLFGNLGRLARPIRETARPDAMPTVTPWTEWLGRHSMLYAKVAEAVKLRAFFRRGDPATRNQRVWEDTSSALDSATRRFEQDLLVLALALRSEGILVVMPEVVHVSGTATTPTDSGLARAWKRAVPFAPPHLVLGGFASYNAAIRRVALKTGSSVIATAGFRLSGPRWYADGDPIHFNDSGAKRMASELADALSRSGIIDSAVMAAHLVTSPSAARN